MLEKSGRCKKKKRQKRGEKVPGCVQVPLSAFQPISEQLGAAAPGYLYSITQLSSHCFAQVRITAEPEMQI